MAEVPSLRVFLLETEGRRGRWRVILHLLGLDVSESRQDALLAHRAVVLPLHLDLQRAREREGRNVSVPIREREADGGADVVQLGVCLVVHPGRSAVVRVKVHGQLVGREALKVRLEERFSLDVEDGRTVEQKERVLEELAKGTKVDKDDVSVADRQRAMRRQSPTDLWQQTWAGQGGKGCVVVVAEGITQRMVRPIRGFEAFERTTYPGSSWIHGEMMIRFE